MVTFVIVSAFKRLRGHIRPLREQCDRGSTCCELSVFHVGDKTHKSGVYVNLRCGCGAKQVGTIRKSSERPTNVDYFRELGRVIQRDHGPTCIASAQELQAAEKDVADASTKRPADEASVSLTEKSPRQC